MNRNDQEKKDGNNVYVGPDYTAMIKSQGNTVILERFVSYLFGSEKFRCGSFVKILRNIAILMVIKTLLEESKTVLDKFRFTDLSLVRYCWQYFRFSEKTYNIVKIDDKWKYMNHIMSFQMLSSFMEQRQIYIGQSGVYYYKFIGNLIKVSVSDKCIAVSAPNITAVTSHVMNELIANNRELHKTGRTSMYNVHLHQTFNVKFEVILPTLAIETDNYIKLEKAMKRRLFIEQYITHTSAPSCTSFNGPPGTSKTTYASYIAPKNIVDRILICNMVQFNTTSSFKEILIMIEKQIEASSKDQEIRDKKEIILLIVDEIDKWLDTYINNQIMKLRDEASRQVEKKDKDGNQTKVEKVKLSKEEEEEKCIKLREEFLSQLYNLCEGLLLKPCRKYFIIFNTNNYECLFEKTSTHYEATQSRIDKYHFEKMNRDVAIRFVTAFITKIREFTLPTTGENSNDQSIFDEIQREIGNADFSLLKNIHSDIRISYRDLKYIMDKNEYIVANIVEALNEYHKTKNLNASDGKIVNEDIVEIDENDE